MLPLTNFDRLITVKVLAVILIFLLVIIVFNVVKTPQLYKSLAYTLLREAAQRQLLWQTRDYNQIEGDHFIVRYTPRDAAVASLVLTTAEENYHPVLDKLNYQMTKKIPLVIYPTREALGRTFGWQADESAMGVYWAGSIRILSPSVWIDEPDQEKFALVFKSLGPIVHEFAHLVVDYKTGGNYPRWLTEGIAQYVEWQLTGFTVDGSDISGRKLYPFAEMDQDFDLLPDQGLAYRQSLMAVEYLVSLKREEGIELLLDNLKQGETLDDAMIQVYGMKQVDMEKRFNKWMKQAAVQ